MTDLKETVNENIKLAMKAKDKNKLNALRYLKKLFIENDTSKKPISEMNIVIGHVKKLKDSLDMYPKESEQYENLLAEIDVLNEYMPKQLSEDEVKNLIKEIVNSTGNQFGLVMKELSPKIKGKFDGKKATQLVKEIIN